MIKVDIMRKPPVPVGLSNAGAPGRDARVIIGSVETISAGSQAYVTDSGSGNEAILNFGIPRGDDGYKGADGQSAYEYAVQGGYTEDEQTFYSDLAEFKNRATAAAEAKTAAEGAAAGAAAAAETAATKAAEALASQQAAGESAGAAAGSAGTAQTAAGSAVSSAAAAARDAETASSAAETASGKASQAAASAATAATKAEEAAASAGEAAASAAAAQTAEENARNFEPNITVTRTAGGVTVTSVTSKGTSTAQLQDGQQGIQGPVGPAGKDFKYSDFTAEQLEALRGPQGPKGDADTIVVTAAEYEANKAYYDGLDKIICIDDGCTVMSQDISYGDNTVKSALDDLYSRLNGIVDGDEVSY